MPFKQADALRYFVFDSLSDLGVVHGVFTRRGGISPPPWLSLNTGGTVGDDPGRVAENRRRLFQALDRPVKSMYDVWQVHGNEVVCVSAPRPADRLHIRADAILTDRPGVTLFMRFADCVPILLYDPIRRVVGLAHAGWQGTVKKIASAVIEAMVEEYGSNPGDLLAGVGPSIGPNLYRVGEDVTRAIRLAFGENSSAILTSKDGEGETSVYLDLWEANCLTLMEAGVRNVELSGLCTASHLEDWYSHRAENGRTGRFGVLIGL